MNVTKGWLSPLILIVAVFSWSALTASAQTQPAPPSTPTSLSVLVYGDANSDAGARGRNHKWPEFMAKNVPAWRVVNRSRSGRALANESRDLNALEAYNAAVRIDSFEVVVIFLGVADVQTPFYEKKDAKLIGESLSELVLKIRQHPKTRHAGILLCSALPIFDAKLPDLFKPLYQGAGGRVLELNAEFARLSKSLGLTYADLHTPLLKDAADFSDGLHAGNATQTKLAALLPDLILQAYQEKPATLILPAATAKGPTTAAAPLVVRVEEDRSLSLAEYAKLGFPPVTREWGTTESERVVKMLLKLAAEDPRRLPRFDSPQSGKLFARLTPADTLKRIREKSSTLTTRYALTMDILNLTPQFLQIYRQASKTAGVFDREQTELLAYSLQFTTVALEQIAELKTQYEKDDPRMVTLAPRFQATTSEAARTLNTALTLFTDKTHFRIAPLVSLADSLTDCISPILQTLPEKERHEVISRLKKLAAVEMDSDLKPALTRLTEQAQG